MARVSPAIAMSVAEIAMEEGIARFRKPLEQIHEEVRGRILHNQNVLRALAEAGLLR